MAGDRQPSFLGIHIPDRPEPLMPITTPTGLLDPNRYTWLRVKGALQHSADSLAKSAGLETLLVTQPPPNIDADLGVACFPLAKQLKKSPAEIAQGLARDSLTLPEIESVVAIGPYLNYRLDYEVVANEVIPQVEQLGSDYGKQNLGHGATVVFDSSSPNIAKPMTVAHLRSTVIGESLGRINEATGHTVIMDNHLGDWGTQFGMLGRAYELWADEVPEIKDGTNPVQGLYKLYVKMHDEIATEKEVLKQKTGEKDPETVLEKEGRAWFKNLEDGDPKARELREWASELSSQEFQRVYAVLGTQFHYELGEGFYVPMLPDVVEAMAQKGLTQTTNDGAIEVKLKDAGMEDLVIQKRDGASLYSTRDFATLAARTAWFKPQRIIYVVGGEQTEYFKQVFESFDRLTDGQGPETTHVSFGMLSLPEGRMSTRRGRVVFLLDVLEEAIAKARERITEKGGGIDPQDIDETARQIGVGAIVYSDLGQGRERNIKFDVEKALSMDGQSAPYIQYARARTVSIGERAQAQGHDIDYQAPIQITTQTERTLVRVLAQYPEAIQNALTENQPAIVAKHTYDIASAYNAFNKEDRIIAPENPTTTNTRLRLNAAAGQVILNGLQLLGIDSPAKM